MYRRLRRAARTALNTTETLNQQQILRHRARQALKGLEQSGHHLSRRMRAEIRDYAEDHLGWQGYAEWLAVYTALAGHFKPGWVPLNYYQAEVMPRINSTYHRIGQRRAMNGQLFDGDEFPDLAYVVNGLVHDRAYRVIPPHQVTEYLADRTDEVVIKADHSDSGLGVRMMPAGEVTHDLLIAGGNGVVQARIMPHEFFHPFSQSALPTLRLATVITDAGTAELRASYLKFGRAGHDSVMANDKLRIPVDPTTGRMDERGFMSCWTPARAHPDNGVAFAGLELPMFRDCVAAVLRMHQGWSLPRFISWDVLPDHQGRVQVMEWEGGVVTFAEATQGPCFADLGWDRLHLSPLVSTAGPRVHPLTPGGLLRRGRPGRAARRPAATPAGRG